MQTQRSFEMGHLSNVLVAISTITVFLTFIIMIMIVIIYQIFLNWRTQTANCVQKNWPSRFVFRLSPVKLRGRIEFPFLLHLAEGGIDWLWMSAPAQQEEAKAAWYCQKNAKI